MGLVALNLRRISLSVLAAGWCSLALPACLASPPPIVVETPFGDVRAETEVAAEEVAALLADLVPKVRASLPGAQDRTIDIWVQDRLRVYRDQERPPSVRGFTLLANDFEARRIHLSSGGDSPWYLAHELVHALVDVSWQTLPALLEEGLADVVACRVNPDARAHIRAHRLLDTSSFTGGIDLQFSFRAHAGIHSRRSMRLQAPDAIPIADAVKSLGMTRSQLHSLTPDIPESYYGIAWLLVARIDERGGMEELHRLCQRAEAEGHAVVPLDWLLEAAQLDLDQLTPSFLAAAFDTREFRRAMFLQPSAYVDAALEALAPWRDRITSDSVFNTLRPAFLLADGTRIPLSTVHPVRELLLKRW